MAAPSTTIYLMNGHLIIEDYTPTNITLNMNRNKIGKVVQVNTQSEPLAVDDIVLYRPDRSIQFVEGTSNYYAVPQTDIVFVFDDSALP